MQKTGSQVQRFLLVGFSTVIIDYVVYWGCLGVLFFGVAVSKGIGFFAGSVFSYWANRYWTFHSPRIPDSSRQRFIILYALTWFLNISVNSTLVEILVDCSMRLELSFILSTTTSALSNFVGMKYWVFNEKV